MAFETNVGKAKSATTKIFTFFQNVFPFVQRQVIFVILNCFQCSTLQFCQLKENQLLLA